MNSTVAPQKAAMLQPPAAGTSPFANPFNIAYLQLSQVSYSADPSTIPSQVAQLPPLDPGGIWQCIWGPAQTSDESNLVFVASYQMSADVPPTFGAVVTRGTDFDIQDGWGIVVQIWEDLDVTKQVPLPWDPSSSARIANGTAETLTDIQNLTSNSQTLLQALTTFLTTPANDFPVLVVTGHSLGGCLTSVIAPWLQSALTGAVSELHIVPATFAAPTAGNADFATYFQNTFSYSQRIYNTLDVIPLGWANLPSIDDIYDSCGYAIPDGAYLAVAGFELAMEAAKVTYAQPATNQLPLTGSCYDASDWYDELFYQHHSTTYMTLLGGQSVIAPQPSAPTNTTPQSHLRKRFGPHTNLVRR